MVWQLTRSCSYDGDGDEGAASVSTEAVAPPLPEQQSTEPAPDVPPNGDLSHGHEMDDEDRPENTAGSHEHTGQNGNYDDNDDDDEVDFNLQGYSPAVNGQNKHGMAFPTVGSSHPRPGGKDDG